MHYLCIFLISQPDASVDLAVQHACVQHWHWAWACNWPVTLVALGNNSTIR